MLFCLFLRSDFSVRCFACQHEAFGCGPRHNRTPPEGLCVPTTVYKPHPCTSWGYVPTAPLHLLGVSVYPPHPYTSCGVSVYQLHPYTYWGYLCTNYTLTPLGGLCVTTTTLHLLGVSVYQLHPYTSWGSLCNHHNLTPIGGICVPTTPLHLLWGICVTTTTLHLLGVSVYPPQPYTYWGYLCTHHTLIPLVGYLCTHHTLIPLVGYLCTNYTLTPIGGICVPTTPLYLLWGICVPTTPLYLLGVSVYQLHPYTSWGSLCTHHTLIPLVGYLCTHHTLIPLVGYLCTHHTLIPLVGSLCTSYLQYVENNFIEQVQVNLVVNGLQVFRWVVVVRGPVESKYKKKCKRTLTIQAAKPRAIPCPVKKKLARYESICLLSVMVMVLSFSVLQDAPQNRPSYQRPKHISSNHFLPKGKGQLLIPARVGTVSDRSACEIPLKHGLNKRANHRLRKSKHQIIASVVSVLNTSVGRWNVGSFVQRLKSSNTYTNTHRYTSKVVIISSEFGRTRKFV